MLSSYDMQCLSRLEERWLDPDANIIPEDEEDDEFEHGLLKGDAEWQEKV